MTSEKMCLRAMCFARPGNLENGLCSDHQVLSGQTYRHVKTGGLYEIVTVAKVEATGDLVVVYRKVQEDGRGSLWVRPLEEFVGFATSGKNAANLPDPERFKKVSDPVSEKTVLTRLKDLQAACRIALAHKDPGGLVSPGFQGDLAAALRESEGAPWEPPADLNPGIRQTVIWMRSHGFETCDSGDGKTHMMEGDAEYAYVASVVAPEDLIRESNRLKDLLMTHLLGIGYKLDNGPKEFNGEIPALPPHVEASYDPVTGKGLIMLLDADDSIMGFDHG